MNMKTIRISGTLWSVGPAAMPHAQQIAFWGDNSAGQSDPSPGLVSVDLGGLLGSWGQCN
jgi:hypothetical protein